MTRDREFDVISEELRANLSEDIRETARVVGVDTADVDEDVRLYGPPGAGKTTNLGLRTAVRAEQEDLDPRDMTVVTYRRSQANNLRDRLVKWGVFTATDDSVTAADAKNPYRYWSTVNAVAARTTGFFDDIDTDGDDLAGMVDEAAKRAFCDELSIRFRAPENWMETPWTAFYTLYTYAKKNVLDVGEWTHLNSDELTPVTADRRAARKLDVFHDQWGSGVSFHAVTARWEEFKREHDVHDFYEQLEVALAPDAPLPPITHLVVDEYHDAYPIMALVLERWIDAADVALVAGDPDQTVNAFSGADPRFFERLGQRVDTDLPVVLLDKSYRCPAEHYEAAASVLREERAVPDLETTGRGPITRFTPTPIDHDDSGTWMLPNPEEPGTPVWLWNEYGTDIMFLARTQRQVDSVAACLDREGIVYKSQDGVGGDWPLRFRLMRALDTVEGVRPDPEAAASEQLNAYNPDDVRGSITPSESNRAFAPAEARALLKHSHNRYVDDLSAALGAVNKAAREENLVPVSSLEQYVTGKWWLRYTNGRSSVTELTMLSDRDTTAMRAAWDRYEDHEFRTDAVADGTKLWTVHASKGDEASEVVLYDGITTRTKNDIEEHDDIRGNEARTWYVGLTRSSDRLHVIRGGHAWTHSYLDDDLERAAVQAAAAKHNGSGSNEVSTHGD